MAVIFQPNHVRLSPYLKFGQISPHQAWYAAENNYHQDDANLDIFRSELGWREFSYHLLHSNPDLKTPCRRNSQNLHGWMSQRICRHGRAVKPAIQLLMRA